LDQIPQIIYAGVGFISRSQSGLDVSCAARCSVLAAQVNSGLAQRCSYCSWPILPSKAVLSLENRHLQDEAGALRIAILAGGASVLLTSHFEFPYFQACN